MILFSETSAIMTTWVYFYVDPNVFQYFIFIKMLYCLCLGVMVS